MLSYEDSKELERLGYPQELKKGDWYWDKISEDTKPHLGLSCSHVCLRTRWCVKVPTTNGMIEGLKKAYSCFHTLSINIFDGGASVDFILADPVSEFLSAKVTGFGDSVEQALCNVWKEQKG